MKIIGLCGGSGSGKGTVSRMFERYGFAYIDTDGVYHGITSYLSPCLSELKEHFGEDIIKDGALCRSVLRDKIFSSLDKEKSLSLLNEITHKHILKETLCLIDKLDKNSVPAVLIDAPVLYESGFDSLCDSVIAVLADTDVRIQRIIERDGIDRERAVSRISSQLPDSELMQRADYTVINNGDLISLENEVRRVAEKILND